MYKNPVTQRLGNPLYASRNVEVDVLRLDEVHPVVSGNKWFKLKYYLEEALAGGKKGLASFGGAYSNHLVALAYECRHYGLSALGVIRGDDRETDNPSLRQMKEAGMQLIFVTRSEYRNKEALARIISASYSDYIIVPEGGMGAQGIRGAEDILQYSRDMYTHIICPVGTGTTLAGLINASTAVQQAIGICALKIIDRQHSNLQKFISDHTVSNNFSIIHDYHFGGYAKRTVELIEFMNGFFEVQNIPSDFVYTGKMFFAVEDLIRNSYFPSASKLLLIHTGGLQGNRSLEPGTLVF